MSLGVDEFRRRLSSASGTLTLVLVSVRLIIKPPLDTLTIVYIICHLELTRLGSVEGVVKLYLLLKAENTRYLGRSSYKQAEKLTASAITHVLGNYAPSEHLRLSLRLILYRGYSRRKVPCVPYR